MIAKNNIVHKDDDEDDSRKIFLSRIPQTFNEEIIQRILETKFGAGCVDSICIVYHDNSWRQKNNDNNSSNSRSRIDKDTTLKTKQPEDDPSLSSQLPINIVQHRGFAFVTMTSSTHYQDAILAETVRGSSSTTSKRKYTMYIRPVLRDDIITATTTTTTTSMTCTAMEGKGCTNNDDENNNRRDICFLWKKYRCPYGQTCKFVHVGEGGCIMMMSSTNPLPSQKDAGDINNNFVSTAVNGQNIISSTRKKCFHFKKNGKCKSGSDCPFLHECSSSTIDVSKQKNNTNHAEEEEAKEKVDKSQIVCINWKNKGKCRKGTRCPYRHSGIGSNGGRVNDNEFHTTNESEYTISGKDEKKGKKDDDDDDEEEEKREKKRKRTNKQRQSLSVRIFGLNYDTTAEDVRKLLQDCGPIMELTFPIFEDSGRSKGYCGVLFQSPKAVAKAILLDGCDMHGRWLRIQEGKMFLRKWEEFEDDRKNNEFRESGSGDDVDYYSKEKSGVGEFGQRVKKRKKHGYKD